MIVFYGSNGMSEAPFIFFLAWAVRRLIMWMVDDDVHHLVAAGGIAMGLAYLTRYDAVVCIAAAGSVVGHHHVLAGAAAAAATSRVARPAPGQRSRLRRLRRLGGGQLADHRTGLRPIQLAVRQCRDSGAVGQHRAGADRRAHVRADLHLAARAHLGADRGCGRRSRDCGGTTGGAGGAGGALRRSAGHSRRSAMPPVRRSGSCGSTSSRCRSRRRWRCLQCPTACDARQAPRQVRTRRPAADADHCAAAMRLSRLACSRSRSPCLSRRGE